ncbi:O-antigen ligase family protein, partial [Nostoc sp. CHAB 5834]|nr:O-antigen ligase family protein [Nostoc sp. CHAB 5834]
IYFNLKGQRYAFLFVSIYIISIPFQFSLPVYSPVIESMSGTLGPKVSINLSLILALILVPLPKLYKEKAQYKLTDNSLLLLLIIILSFLNTYNENKLGTLVFFLFVFGHTFFYRMISNFANYHEIVKGVFEGFVFLCVIQFILAIFFPVLGMKFVTTIFHETGGDNATRMDTRSGAIGLFVHPGNLAIFTIIASMFFLSSIMKGHKKSQSKIILLFNIMTIILTYSRTAYLVFFVSTIITILIYRKPEVAIFSLSNILKFIIPVCIIFSYIIFFSPLSEVFLKSDSNEQIDNRLVHWMMAYEAFNVSPFIGVGLNAHLEYFTKHSSELNLNTLVDFFIKNPIHNIHLAILAETGIAGIIIWFVFISRNILHSKKGISLRLNEIFCSTNIGIIVAICLYGITGWAPLSTSIMPFILFFSFFGLIHTKNYVTISNKYHYNQNQNKIHNNILIRIQEKS